MLATRVRWMSFLVVVAVAHTAAADNDARLFAGVRAFRAGDFSAAVAEFEALAGAAAPPDLPLYLGPALYKLGRDHEARAVLAPFHRSPLRDPVADYYLGLTYHRLGLRLLARRTFDGLDRKGAGPKLADGAARFIAAIDAQPVAGVGVDGLIARAERLSAQDPDLALDDASEAYLRAPLGSPDRVRAAQLVVKLAAVAAPAVALELVDHPELLSPSVELELARAALRLGVTDRAGAMIEDARRRGDPAIQRAADALAPR